MILNFCLGLINSERYNEASLWSDLKVRRSNLYLIRDSTGNQRRDFNVFTLLVQLYATSEFLTIDIQVHVYHIGAHCHDPAVM